MARKKLTLEIDGTVYEFLTFPAQKSLDLWAKNMGIFAQILAHDGDLSAALETISMRSGGVDMTQLAFEMIKASDWRVEIGDDEIKANPNLATESKNFDLWFSDKLAHLPLILKFLAMENWQDFFVAFTREVAGSRVKS